MREMKDSGIEWIGEIPKDWDKGHLKYYTQIKTGGTPSTSNQVWFDGDVLWFTPGDFDNILLNDSKRKLSNLAVLFRVANLFPANTTMIVGIGGTAGKVGYTIKESYCNQQITALINKSNTYPKYITYLMLCFSDVLKDNALYTTLPILNNQFIGNFSICIPKKLSEQRKIADFLDSKCSEIDATAENIQKEISLLEEYKKSVITEAVTKGLNPDAEMKDSGVEWIGEIPKHWNVVAVKHCFYINNGSDPITDEGEIPVYGSGSKSFKTCKEFKEGPTVLLGRKGTINIPQWIESRYWNVDTAFDVKAKGNYDLKLFYYCAVCFDYERYTTQTALPSMTQGDYKNFKIPYMNFYEQKDIVKFLDSKCSEIDTLIADKKRQLDILADYKKSLIYEYVTGKKEVPVNE